MANTDRYFETVKTALDPDFNVEENPDVIAGLTGAQMTALNTLRDQQHELSLRDVYIRLVVRLKLDESDARAVLHTVVDRMNLEDLKRPAGADTGRIFRVDPSGQLQQST